MMYFGIVDSGLHFMSRVQNVSLLQVKTLHMTNAYWEPKHLDSQKRGTLI